MYHKFLIRDDQKPEISSPSNRTSGRPSNAILSEKLKKDSLEIFNTAIDNSRPLLELKPRRIGGATYQVPIEVKGTRQLTLTYRWILKAARARKGKAIAEKLALELTDASNKVGAAMKKKEDVQRMADSNRAFARFA